MKRVWPAAPSGVRRKDQEGADVHGKMEQDVYDSWWQSYGVTSCSPLRPCQLACRGHRHLQAHSRLWASKVRYKWFS